MIKIKKKTVKFKIMDNKTSTSVVEKKETRL